MQTFLSEPTFAWSASVIDNVRLNKQLLEGYQILKAIAQTPLGGGQRIDGRVPFASNHPATNQWRGSEGVLFAYLFMVRDECAKRGIKWDKNWDNINEVMLDNPHFATRLDNPDWILDPVARNRVLLTHRYNLYIKDQDHYSQYADTYVEVAPAIKRLVCCPGKHAPYYYPTHDGF